MYYFATTLICLLPLLGTSVAMASGHQSGQGPGSSQAGGGSNRGSNTGNTGRGGQNAFSSSPSSAFAPFTPHSTVHTAGIQAPSTHSHATTIQQQASPSSQHFAPPSTYHAHQQPSSSYHAHQQPSTYHAHQPSGSLQHYQMPSATAAGVTRVVQSVQQPSEVIRPTSTRLSDALMRGQNTIPPSSHHGGPSAFTPQHIGQTNNLSQAIPSATGQRTAAPPSSQLRRSNTMGSRGSAFGTPDPFPVQTITRSFAQMGIGGGDSGRGAVTASTAAHASSQYSANVQATVSPSSSSLLGRRSAHVELEPTRSAILRPRLTSVMEESSSGGSATRAALGRSQTFGGGLTRHPPGTGDADFPAPSASFQRQTAGAGNMTGHDGGLSVSPSIDISRRLTSSEKGKAPAGPFHQHPSTGVSSSIHQQVGAPSASLSAVRAPSASLSAVRAPSASLSAVRAPSASASMPSSASSRRAPSANMDIDSANITAQQRIGSSAQHDSENENGGNGTGYPLLRVRRHPSSNKGISRPAETAATASAASSASAPSDIVKHFQSMTADELSEHISDMLAAQYTDDEMDTYLNGLESAGVSSAHINAALAHGATKSYDHNRLAVASRPFDLNMTPTQSPSNSGGSDGNLREQPLQPRDDASSAFRNPPSSSHMSPAQMHPPSSQRGPSQLAQSPLQPAPTRLAPSSHISPPQMPPPSSQRGPSDLVTSPLQPGATQLRPSSSQRRSEQVAPSLSAMGPPQMPPPSSQPGATQLHPSSSQRRSEQVAPSLSAMGPPQMPPPSSQPGATQMPPPTSQPGATQMSPPTSQPGATQMPPPSSQPGATQLRPSSSQPVPPTPSKNPQMGTSDFITEELARYNAEGPSISRFRLEIPNVHMDQQPSSTYAAAAYAAASHHRTVSHQQHLPQQQLPSASGGTSSQAAHRTPDPSALMPPSSQARTVGPHAAGPSSSQQQTVAPNPKAAMPSEQRSHRPGPSAAATIAPSVPPLAPSEARTRAAGTSAQQTTVAAVTAARRQQPREPARNYSLLLENMGALPEELRPPARQTTVPDVTAGQPRETNRNYSLLLENMGALPEELRERKKNNSRSLDARFARLEAGMPADSNDASSSAPMAPSTSAHAFAPSMPPSSSDLPRPTQPIYGSSRGAAPSTAQQQQTPRDNRAPSEQRAHPSGPSQSPSRGDGRQN